MNLYDEKNDVRAQIGVGAQLNIWDEDLQKYKLLMPLESVPAVVGSTNTVDIDLLTSRIITKIEGKKSVDDKDVTFLWHRDNLRVLREIADKQCKFLVSYPDYTGWAFEGNISYRPDDATSDKLTGTFTIIANDVDDKEIDDVRPLMAKTCFITSTVPAIANITANAEKPFKIALKSVTTGATFTARSSVDTITANVDENSNLTITSTTPNVYGIVEITATKTGMASYTTTIAVETI